MKGLFDEFGIKPTTFEDYVREAIAPAGTERVK